MKVICLNQISPLGTSRFSTQYTFTENINEAELVLVRSQNMLEMEIPTSLLSVARAGAGVNNIPLDKMAEKGVVVFNTPGANANGVKELVLAGMLLASRDIVGGINWVKENAADASILKTIEKAKAAFSGTEISGKTIGVIGLGAVGGKVASACLALGLNVIGYDPYISEEALSMISEEVTLVADLNEIYKVSDFISLHLPLLDSTKQMVNASVFSIMKPGAVLLNFSRDLLVDDESLEQAIHAGIVKKYVTDFPNHKTANMEGVIAIPHLGASTEESEDNCAVMAVDQLMQFVEEGKIVNSVNFPKLSPGRKISKNRILILHRNQDHFLGELTKLLQKDVVVLNLVNQSKGAYSATVVDFDQLSSEALVEKINTIEGVLKTRII